MKKPRAHLIVLEPTSTIGRIYAQGNNDGFETHTGAPTLLCSSVAMDNAYGISAIRDLKSTGSHQSLLIPFHAIALIVDLDDPGERPFGFAPTKGASPER